MRAGNLRPEYDRIVACHVHADVRSRIRRYEMAAAFRKLDEIFQGLVCVKALRRRCSDEGKQEQN